MHGRLRRRQTWGKSPCLLKLGVLHAAAESGTSYVDAGRELGRYLFAAVSGCCDVILRQIADVKRPFRVAEAGQVLEKAKQTDKDARLQCAGVLTHSSLIKTALDRVSQKKLYKASDRSSWS